MIVHNVYKYNDSLILSFFKERYISTYMERFECSLSLEEQEELARSNKKVKNVNHVGFYKGQSSGSSSPSFAGGSGSQNASFKDKLMGEIPGAYTQAFCFEEFMDDDAESDDKVETLRQGMVAVKFSKDFGDLKTMGEGFDCESVQQSCWTKFPSS